MGARAQSFSYTLKAAGAAAVATVVLGRHVDVGYPPSKRLLKAISTGVFDTARGAVDEL